VTTAKKDAAPGQNSYELRQAARKERLLSAATSADRESGMVYTATKNKASLIPFGQPIHVGHYSEGRDRNFRKSISRGFGKAFALADKAEYYRRKAESVGTGGISSDDPDALVKLKAQLADAQAAQERMKKVNAFIRREDRDGIKNLGYSDDDTTQFFKPDFCGRVGFPSYRLSNNNANINRLKDRIAELERHAERTDKERVGSGYTYREDTAENRVMFLFDGKPSEQIRKLLKRNGFKWSPSRGAWVRALNNVGVTVGQIVCKSLDAIPE